jgi:hypothetical protein
LLIGTGGGEPGLAAFVRSLIGNIPLDVAVLDKDPRQAGGIAQLNPRHVYVADSDVLNGVPATVIADGAMIDLGLDANGKPLRLEAASFQSNGLTNLSLLNSTDRVLFAGNTFEQPPPPPARPGPIPPNPEKDKAARSAWLAKMNGRFDVAYLATSALWYTSPETLATIVSPPPPAGTGAPKAP